MREINELIWHCTDTPEGREVSVAEIDQWHKQRGWWGIGYHKVVHLDGSVSDGRPIWKMGAHVSGHNRGTIGYVYVGGVDKHMSPKDTRTTAQKETMRRLTREAISEYGIKKVSGHRDYAARACPCFDAPGEYGWMVNSMAFNDPASLKTSRTAKGATMATLAGTGLTVDAAANTVNEVQDGLDQISVGNVVSVVVGLVVITGALLALYARWDDAGRPTLKEIIT
ncbi:N-acetylmuramoyl-L-alanine amidase [Cohaesibacter sp. ES.047]|uniref:N-acetylmuramoyl-L-alanine amidase n=1 Tax=Cohaesibacter sp. ES.047 TaxID=1798205 RepID=UPI000BB6D2B3|nr:N-acetylmuramoyl-L-alanine amidase [Cohaesibacter sp. ES.047]SNY93498.1 N-acetylmuramoyl-L-alanine amidase [Cohaesibacter sp. ES.047]